MQLKTIFDEFNRAYHNNPMPFEDVISSDGVRNSYELSYNPLCDYDPYRPQVYNGSELLLEGSDYTIDYEKGIITFIKIPPAEREGIKFIGFFMKCNLREFIDFYNRSVRLMQITFPPKKMIEINFGKDIADDPEDSVEYLDLDKGMLRSIHKVYEVFQNKTDKYSVPFTQRDKLILFSYDNINMRGRFNSDYGYHLNSNLAGVKFPFYIYGELKLDEVEFSNIALDTPVYFEDNSRNQLIILLGRFMYDAWSHKSTPLIATVLNIANKQDLRITLQALDLQLYGDLRSNFSKVAIPNTYKKDYSKND